MADRDSQASNSHIFDIIARSDITSLRQSLSIYEVDIETRDPAGRTALHLAIIAASADVCQFLINHGANIDTWTEQGEVIVHLAAKRGEVDILHIIIASLKAKQIAVQGNADLNHRTAVGWTGEHIMHVNCLTQNHKLTPLYIAVALGMLCYFFFYLHILQ